MITPQHIKQTTKNYYQAFVQVGEVQENVQHLLYQNTLTAFLKQIIANNVVSKIETADARKERLIAIFLQQIASPITEGLRESMIQEVINTHRGIEEKRRNNVPLTSAEIRIMNTQQQYIEVKFNHAFPLFMNEARHLAVAFFEDYQWSPQADISSPPKRLR